MKLEELQAALRQQGMDAWLFCDVDYRDPIAYRVLGLPTEQMVSRRWYYLVPAEGEPRKLVHQIEKGQLDALPGEAVQYAGWRELLQRLEQMLDPVRTVAMQYSPCNQLPAVSLVDAGTVELVRGFGKQVVSSAELVQQFEARWSPAALEMHLEAGRLIDDIIALAFQEIGKCVRRDSQTDEHAIQQFILERFRQCNLITDKGPIVAAGRNSGNPHYLPERDCSAPIRREDFVLLDVWGKLNRPGAVYYDVTWTGFVGERAPEAVQEIFEIVRTARDGAFDTVRRAVAQGRALRGWEVDRAARGVVERSGYGDRFVHRTGHSIGEDVHGNGANMDDLETHDERQVIPHTGFSIEPGIYLPQFGVRSEINVFVGEQEARITGPVQTEIVLIAVNATPG
jgi:Xaa-Pro aminopeptidase